MPQHKRKILLFFLAIYVLFGGALIYLLLFNVGLEIEERLDPLSGSKGIFVKNSSSRTIYNISVSYMEGGEKKEILFIKELKAGEERKIDYSFPPELTTVELLVEAPYHQAASRPIMLKLTGTGLTYNFKVQQRMFKGVDFNCALEICNDADAAKDVVVEELHDLEFIEGWATTRQATIASMDCEELQYVFTPKKAGLTKIIFNIKVQNITDKREITIRVEE